MDGTAIKKNIPDNARANGKRAVLSRAVRLHPLAVEFLLAFTAFFGRYLFYGWRYFTQSGDYAALNNHAAYHISQGDPIKYLARTGVLSGSPLAGLTDVYVWSRFFGNLILLSLLFSALYAAAAVIFRGVFEKIFGTGCFFTVVFCLFPFAMDGLYVLSKASRLVVAFLFAALAARFMLRLKETGNLVYLPLFSLAQLLTFGYHEGVAFLSAVICAVIALKNRNKYSLGALMIASNFCVYALYIQLGRLMFNIADAETFAGGYYAGVLLPALRGSLTATASFSPAAFFTSFGRGIGVIFGERGFLFFAALAAFCVLLALVLRRSGATAVCRATGMRQGLDTLICGVIFIAAGVAPAYLGLLRDFSSADFVPAMCGVALLLDLALRAVARGKRLVFVPVVVTAVFVFCVAGISELHDYRAVSEFDLETADSVIRAVDQSIDPDSVNDDSAVAVINIKPGPDISRVPGAGDIPSATSDAGTFTEMLRAVSGDGRFPTVTAMPVDDDGYFYYESDGDAKRVENFDHIFVATDYALIRVIPARGFTDGDYDPRANYVNYLLYTEDFTRLAHVSEYGSYGIFKFY